MWQLRVTMLLLLATGCAADNPPPSPPLPAASAPPISSTTLAAPRPAPAPASAQSRGDDFDALLAAIATGGAPDSPGTTGYPASTQPEAPIGGSSTPLLGTGQSPQVSYGDNLEICLDGRWSAFCRHDMLTSYDAAQVEIAEYNATVAACLDVQQRQFCQLEQLRPPDVYRVRAAWLITPEMPFDDGAPPTASGPEVVTSPTVGVTQRRFPPPAQVPTTPHRFTHVPSAPIEATEPQPAGTHPEDARPSTEQGQIEAASVRPASLSAAAITQRLIAASISAYPGRCPCPYIRDRAGRLCGARSAYTRPGGYGPLCFPADVTPAMIQAYRERGAE